VPCDEAWDIASLLRGVGYHGWGGAGDFNRLLNQGGSLVVYIPMGVVCLRRLVAIRVAFMTHGLFAVGVGAMVLSLFDGLRSGLGPFHGRAALAANLLLVLQYPVLHSFGLTARGRRLLARLAPRAFARDLSASLYVAFASFQLLCVFALWSPTGVVLWEAQAGLRALSIGLYTGSWLLLAKAMQDAGLPVQMGFLGWRAVWRGEPPRYGPMPEQGLFRWCRQPVYIAFALTLWTGPRLTLDRLLIAIPWTAYCVLGPLLKERRYFALYGARFAAYRERVPYWLPRFSARSLARR